MKITSLNFQTSGNSNGFTFWGSILFITLALMSITFVKQRLYLDSSWYLFQILQNSEFAIEHYRFSAILMQLPALTASYLQFPVSVVTILFSVTPVLLHFLLFSIVGRRYKQPATATFLAIVQVLTVREYFFLTGSEALFACTLSITFLGFIQYSKARKLNALVYSEGLLILILSAFAHPSAFVCNLIALLYLIVFENNKIITLRFAGLFVMVFILKWLVVPSSTYEQNILQQIPNYLYNLKHPTSVYGWSYFTRVYEEVFSISAHIVSISVFYFLWKRKIKELLAMVILIVTTFLLILVLSAYGDGDIMMEKSFLPLSFAVAIVPSMRLLQDEHSQLRTLPKLGVVILLFLSLKSIYRTSEKYVARTNRIIELTNKAAVSGNSFHWIAMQQLPSNYFMGTWSLPYETMLLTSIDKKMTISILPVDSVEQAKQIPKGKFIGATFMPPIAVNQLRKAYFNISGIDYQELKR